MVLNVEGVVVHVERRTADRHVVFNLGFARHPQGNQPVGRIEGRRAARVGEVVGVEDVIGCRLGVSAGQLAAEELVAAFELVASAAVEGRGDARRELTVVAFLRVGGVEVRRVVQHPERRRVERRVDDAGARPAAADEREPPLGEPRFSKDVVAHHGAVAREQIPVRVLLRGQAVGIRDRVAEGGGRRYRLAVVQIATLNRVAWPQIARQLDLAALVLALLGDAGYRFPAASRCSTAVPDGRR